MSEAGGARYRLLRRLGAGGMAEVVEAIATGARGFERRVAIKWMLPEVEGEESIRRMFLDEAQIASHLHHGNIVQVLDFGVLDGSEFIVFELVDGTDLNQASKRAGGVVPETVALFVMTEIAHALAHAHSRQDVTGQPLSIVHRDVSPGNVLLSWDGDVKLSDFGIAFAAKRSERTATGFVKGKASYMAPEQALGGEITSAVDIYALGATLHKLLAGTSPSLYGMPASAEPPSTLAEDVNELIEACLAHDPEQRPSARAVAEIAERLRGVRTRDTGRRELREWLAPMRSGGRPVRAVDRFVNKEVRETTPGSRIFTVTGPEGEPVTTTRFERDEGAGAEDAASSSTDAKLPGQRRLGLWFVGAGLATAAIAGGAYVSLDGDGWPTAVGGTLAMDAGRESSDAGSAVDGGPAEEVAEPRADAALDASAPIPLDVGRRPPGRREGGHPPAQPLPVRPPPAQATGYLGVTGRSFHGKEIVLDGRPTGVAVPSNRIRTSVGPHDVEIRSDDGETLAHRTCEVRAGAAPAEASPCDF